LRRGQVVDAQRRHYGHTQFASGEYPTVTGDDVAVTIDEYGNNKAEGFDALLNLPDLFLAMAPRVRRVRFQSVDPTIKPFRLS